MSAEQKDAANKQSRRRAVTSTIKRSLKGEWQALSTSSSPRTSLNLDQEAPGESSSASGLLSPIHLHADVERQRSVWSRRGKKKKETAMVRSLADLLVTAQPSSAPGTTGTNNTERNGCKHDKDRSSASWALTWSGRKRRLGGSRRNLGKTGVGGSSDDDDDEGDEHSRPMLRRRHGLSNATERAEYPQSDDPASGQSARERKRQIDAVYDQTVQMARDLGTSLNITRMEAAGFLSLARWDVDTALRQLHIVLCTHDGVLYNIDPRIQMCGAVNSGGTSCYIDSLLMALFGAQSSFDALLYVRDLGSESSNKLLAITRLYVNFMRAGVLIDVWLVEEMRSALLACGWLGGALQAETMGSAQKQQQQDTSELYLFLMDVLQMPYLPLEMRMVHGADHDTADCKMVTQRMVELSFPEENSDSNSENDSGKDSTDASNKEHPLLLQALLESYFFDNRVEQLERSLKSSSESGKPTSTKVRTNAWSFLSIYPFYTPQSEFDIHGPRSTATAEYPDDAPFILPLLIKRYAVDERGRVHRVKRRVIIPMVLDVTNIVSVGDDIRCVDEKTGSVGSSRGGQSARVSRAQTAGSEQQTPLPPPYPSRIQYRLVLRSAVCHKGANVRSGHYISFSTRLRMARPTEIARRLRSTRGTTEQRHHASSAHAQPGDGSGTLPSAGQQHTMSFSNISGGGGGGGSIMRWRTFAHAASSTSRESSTNAPVTGADAEAEEYHSMQASDKAEKQRRHSWPLSGSKDSIGQHLDSILYGANSKSSTPSASLYGSQIHGSAADWEKYAMTIDLDEQQQEHREDEWLRNIAAIANTSKEALHEEYQHRHQQPPPPYPLEEDTDAGALETQRLCYAEAAECESTTGELLRFDDMDIAHGRVQNFSTGEGGRRCLDEISRDGYLLFYALQRVEMQASEDENEDEEEQEEAEEVRVGMGDYSGHIPEESPSQAMDELSSALRRNECDEQARRIIAALLHNSGAVDSQRSIRHSDFERMAMRWQNIRLDKQTSPVGPLLGSRSRWPQHHQQSQQSQKSQFVDELDSDSSRDVLHPACQTGLETSIGGLSLDAGPAGGVEKPLLSSRSSESGQRRDDAVRQHQHHNQHQHHKKKGAATVGMAAADSAEARDETKAVRGRHSGTTSDRWCKIM
ncbi:hypothetical protein IWW48_004770 [Coemansia sp. RSA 1200]|nr:hypothetical protein IWW48_004770 [Coemansia sp. RSA 1200]